MLNKKIIPVLFIMALLSSCTDNERAKNYGGTMIVKTLKNEKFVNITWKGDDLWILTQDTVTKIFHFREDSPYGVIQGEVIISGN